MLPTDLKSDVGPPPPMAAMSSASEAAASGMASGATPKSLSSLLHAAISDPTTCAGIHSLLEEGMRQSGDGGVVEADAHAHGRPRLPVHQRAVTPAFLRDFISPELLPRSPGQAVHGKHTVGGADDWKHFDMA